VNNAIVIAVAILVVDLVDKVIRSKKNLNNNRIIIHVNDRKVQNNWREAKDKW